MSTDTLGITDTNTGPMLGFKVAVLDCHGGEEPETVAGSIVFSNWLSQDDGSTLFTYRDVAIGIWNLSRVLSDAGLLSWGIGWALAPEDGADPATAPRAIGPTANTGRSPLPGRCFSTSGRTTGATSTCPSTSSRSRGVRAARNAGIVRAFIGRTTALGSPWLLCRP